MSSFDSLKKTIFDFFNWSDTQQQPNKIQTNSQNHQFIFNTDQQLKNWKSQKQTPSTKNDANPQNSSQRKPQQHRKTVISYLKDILIEEQVQCLICINKYRKPGVTKLFLCQHQYCKLCLKEFVNMQLSNFSLPKCPQQQCNSDINKQTGYFKSLNPKTRQLFDKIQKFHFTSNDPFLKMCPSENCQGIIPVIEDHPFQCIQCQNQFCRKCMYFKHEGKCAKNEAVFLNMKYNYCKCNKCGIIVEKSEACDHMTCKCGNEFCYKCGRKWIGAHHCPVRKINKAGKNNSRDGSQDSISVNFFKFLGKLVATLAVICFIAIYAVTCIIPMIIGILIIGLISGIIFFPFKCIYDKFKNKEPGLGAVLIILFPFTILLGIYTGFKQYWCVAMVSWWGLLIIAIEKAFDGVWH